MRGDAPAQSLLRETAEIAPARINLWSKLRGWLQHCSEALLLNLLQLLEPRHSSFE